MSIKRTPWKIGLIGLFTLGVLAGCLVGAGGYDGSVGVGYVGGYYAPGGYEYGGWGHGYRVAPPRGGRPEGHGGRGAPSIPSRPRGH
jgi:hypothetical protein